MNTHDLSAGPIGVFDSGVGGLTVYRELRRALPREDFIYLGDLARLPFGTKSADTVIEYALQAARFMHHRQVKLLTIACNTVSAVAVPAVQRAFPWWPCIGVIEPGAREAAHVSANGRVLVLSTESTLRSGAYPAAIKAVRPEASVIVVACNVMVSLAEQGWHEGSEAESIVARYLAPFRGQYDTIVLGCTHFPLLEPAIRRLVASDVAIVNSATTVARAVKANLEASNLLNLCDREAGDTHFLATDTPESFLRIAGPFLQGQQIPEITHVHLQNPGDQSAASMDRKTAA